MSNIVLNMGYFGIKTAVLTKKNSFERMIDEMCDDFSINRTYAKKCVKEFKKDLKKTDKYFEGKMSKNVEYKNTQEWQRFLDDCVILAAANAALNHYVPLMDNDGLERSNADFRLTDADINEIKKHNAKIMN